MRHLAEDCVAFEDRVEELLKPDHAQVRGETLVCMYCNGLRVDQAEFHSAFSHHLSPHEESTLTKTLGISQSAS